MADESKDMERKSAERAQVVRQVNKCTIMSPDMSPLELARLLTGVGLCLADVKIRPMGGEKHRKPLEVVVSGVVETKDVTESAW